MIPVAAMISGETSMPSMGSGRGVRLPDGCSTPPALFEGSAVKRPRKLSTDRARRFCHALGNLSDRRTQRWRMIDSIAQKLGVPWDEAETVANEAAAE